VFYVVIRKFTERFKRTRHPVLEPVTIPAAHEAH
jgi:hypothetical protein